MSTNEELVAAASEHLAHNVWDDEIFVLADQLVTALEQVTAERDKLLSAEELAAEDRGRLIAERDALAAVVEQVKQRSEDSVDAQYGTLNASYVLKLLAQAPSVALDRVKAEALRDAADLAGSIDGGYEVELWLTERADRIEKGESND